MNRISKIFYRHITGNNSKEENLLLKNLSADNDTVKDIIDNLSDNNFLAQDMKRRAMVDYERPMRDMIFRINAIKRRRRLTVLSWSGAATIMVCIIVLPIYINHSVDKLRIAKGEIEDVPVQNINIESIKHGLASATLHTSNGATVELSAEDTLKTNISTAIEAYVKPDDKVIEQLSLEVPRGAEFKIVLEDSTAVWLNSQSTLVYPEVFGAKERKVTLMGEAYFEVKSDSERPFIVNAGNQTVKVYGTCFNVRAYDDEDFVSTTLESGLISIARADIPSGEVKIRPGHQARLNKEEDKLQIRQVDPAIISSWRNGYFVFEEQPLYQIMQDLSRWYNFQYEIPDKATAGMVFMGSIPRYADFKAAISILEKIGNLKFYTRGDKVIVTKIT